MAFWEKSEDPWDIDPAKRKREQTTWSVPQEVSGLEENGEDESFLSEVAGLFKKKPDPIENLPDMVCPWCGKEMTKGYLTGGRDMIRWSAEKPGAVFGSAFLDTVDIQSEGVLSNYKTSWYCASCRRLVVDVPEPPADTFAWDGNPPSPSAEEETTD